MYVCREREDLKVGRWETGFTATASSVNKLVRGERREYHHRLIQQLSKVC
jgi:hypothetical protein